MYRTGIADRHSAMEYKHERDENAFLFVCLFVYLFVFSRSLSKIA